MPDLGRTIFTSTLQPKNLSKALKRCDVVIGAVRGKNRAPILVSDSMVANMKNGSELVFGNSPAELETFNKMLDIDMVEFSQVVSSLPRETNIITDNTPVTEYQYGWLAGKLGLIDPQPWQASWPQSGK